MTGVSRFSRWPSRRWRVWRSNFWKSFFTILVQVIVLPRRAEIRSQSESSLFISSQNLQVGLRSKSVRFRIPRDSQPGLRTPSLLIRSTRRRRCMPVPPTVTGCSLTTTSSSVSGNSTFSSTAIPLETKGWPVVLSWSFVRTVPGRVCSPKRAGIVLFFIYIKRVKISILVFPDGVGSSYSLSYRLGP